MIQQIQLKVDKGSESNGNMNSYLAGQDSRVCFKGCFFVRFVHEKTTLSASFKVRPSSLTGISSSSLGLMIVPANARQNLLNGQLCVSESDCVPLLWVVFFASIIVMWTMQVLK
jgi:hypothetical protein